ncbi:MAG: hypothetical protein O2985_12570 [Proteobacteria bacterium]|nr:hypothetical protein [Pseudomonadota bacterium]
MLNSSGSPPPTVPQSFLFCIPPLIAFAIAAYPLSGWLVDDAGISFAYARNLANGDGFVSQPGKDPVEGFSNPLWTLMFVPGFWLNYGVPLWAAKIFGHVFSYGAFFFGFQIVLQLTRSPLAACLAMIFLALNTSFVVWNVSGLENALYAFEIVTLVYLCLLTLDRLSWQVAATAGLLAAASALTRPEGVVFALLWPSAVLFRTIGNGTLSAAALQSCLAYFVAVAVPVIAYRGMAFVYFDTLLPNTYYAKGGPSIATVLGILLLDPSYVYKGYDLFRSTFIVKGLFSFALVTFALVIFAKRATAPLIFLVGASALALFTYVLLPTDWMMEFRFGTPFLVLFYPTLFSLIWLAGASFPRIPIFIRQAAVIFVILVFSASSTLVHSIRLNEFYDKPTVPFAVVADLFGDRFNRAAKLLGVEQASLLLPDIGGTLFYSELEIFDLAGLTDATIARSLRKDLASLHGYIFDQIRPTFIHTHGYWALVSDLDAGVSFREQYIPLRESVDAVASASAGRIIYSGDYVRKDAVEGNAEVLARTKTALYGPP